MATKWEQGPKQVQQPYLNKAVLSRRIKGVKKKPGWAGVQAASKGEGTPMLKQKYKKGPDGTPDQPYPGLATNDTSMAFLAAKIKKHQRSSRRSM